MQDFDRRAALQPAIWRIAALDAKPRPAAFQAGRGFSLRSLIAQHLDRIGARRLPRRIERGEER
jgi:hypothetical protein